MSKVGVSRIKQDDGEWRFVITSYDDNSFDSGRLITGLDGSESDDGRGLTEAQARRLLVEHFGLSESDTDKAVTSAREG